MIHYDRMKFIPRMQGWFTIWTSNNVICLPSKKGKIKSIWSWKVTYLIKRLSVSWFVVLVWFPGRVFCCCYLLRTCKDSLSPCRSSPASSSWHLRLHFPHPIHIFCVVQFKPPFSQTWRRQWHPTPVLLPGESQGRGSLVGCRLWGHTESDMTEVT